MEQHQGRITDPARQITNRLTGSPDLLAGFPDLAAGTPELFASTPDLQRGPHHTSPV